MKIIKRVFQVFFIGILLLIIAAVLLVRFTNLTISNNGKAVLGYNEETARWVLNNWEMRPLKGLDGPYVYKENGELRVIQLVEKEDRVVFTEWRETLDSINTFDVVVDNEDKDQFTVSLQREYFNQPSSVAQPAQLVAISDIEGNFDAFQCFLQANSVIDEQMKWSFGNGHLVLVGDFMDRGDNVTQVLWLIYQLEQEAEEAGGKVHFVLGNHEAMNLQNWINYVNKKYIAIAQKVANERNYKTAYGALMNENNELVRWLKTKNLMLKIGDNLFVHGGISPALIDSDLTIDDINAIGQRTITQRLYNATDGDANANLIASRLGPLWYRGLVTDYKEYYKKSTAAMVDEALDRFNARRIIIGHTVVEEVSADYGGKVLRIDVKHGKQKNTGKTQGILIEGDKVFKINDLGNKIILNTDD